MTKKCLEIDMNMPKTGKTTASVIRAIGEILEAGGCEILIENQFADITGIQKLFERITELLKITLEYRIQDGLLFVRSTRPEQLLKLSGELDLSTYRPKNEEIWINNFDNSRVIFIKEFMDHEGKKAVLIDNLDRRHFDGTPERTTRPKKHFHRTYHRYCPVSTTIR
jgi:hypothetical protein